MTPRRCLAAVSGVMISVLVSTAGADTDYYLYDPEGSHVPLVVADTTISVALSGDYQDVTPDSFAFLNPGISVVAPDSLLPDAFYRFAVESEIDLDSLLSELSALDMVKIANPAFSPSQGAPPLGAG